MKPGDPRTHENGNGNAVVSAVELWAARDGIHLRVDTTDDGAPAAATNGAESVRDHRILFRDLREVLIANGCWEASCGGAEPQASGSGED